MDRSDLSVRSWANPRRAWLRVGNSTVGVAIDRFHLARLRCRVLQQLGLDFSTTNIERPPNPLGERVRMIVHQGITELDFKLAGCTCTTKIRLPDLAGGSDTKACGHYGRQCC